MITRDDIRSILVNCAALGLSAETSYQAELVMDSFTLVWIKYALEEQHGVAIDPQFEDMDLFTSVNGIHAYLAKRFPDRISPVEENIDD